MLKWRTKDTGLALLVCVLVVFGAFVASSNPPANSHYDGRSNQQPGTYTKNEDAEKLTAKYTLWLAVGTFFLVGVTVVVNAVQFAFLRRAEITARTSADAAKKAAEAVPLIERAYIFVSIRPYGGFAIRPDGSFVYRASVIYSNYGKTPAILKMIRAYGIVSKEIPSKLIEHPWSGRELPEGLVIEANGKEPDTMEIIITKSEKTEIDALTTKLYVVGMIRYKDVLGEIRESGFCWSHSRRSDNTESFIICPNTKLNYQT